MKISWGEVVFYCFVATVPLTYIPIVPDPAHSIVFGWLSLGFLFYTLIQFKYLTEPLYYNKWIAYLMLSLGTIASIFFVITPSNSETRLEYFRLIFFLSTYVFFLIHSHLCLHLYKTLVVSGIIYLGYGIYDYSIYYTDSDIHNGLYQIRAHIGHKNLAAIYLSMTFPFAYQWIIQSRQRYIKYSLAIYIFIAVIIIFLFRTRVGLGGLIINFIAFLAMIQYKKKINWKYALIGIVMIGVFSHFTLRNNSNYQNSLTRIYKTFTFNKERDKDNQSISERFILWDKTVELIKDYPLSGVGMGLWKIHILSKDIGDTRAKFGNIIFQQPHNDFLWIASEMGIMVGTLYLFLFLYGIYIFYKNRFNGYYAHLIALLILFLASLVDFPKERPIFLFFLAYLLASIPANTSLKTKNLSVSLWIIIGINVLFFSQRILGEMNIMRLLGHRAKGEQVNVLTIARNILTFNIQYDHTSTPIDFYIGEAHFLKGNTDSSIIHFKQSLIYNPNHLYTWNNIATAYLKNKDDLNAVIAWNKSIQIANDFAEPRLNLANYCLGNNDLTSAESILHFNIEDDDVVRYKHFVDILADKLIHSNERNLPVQYLSELPKLLQDKKRKLWLMKQFCRNELDFKTQLINDINYFNKNKSN